MRVAAAAATAFLASTAVAMRGFDARRGTQVRHLKLTHDPCDLNHVQVIAVRRHYQNATEAGLLETCTSVPLWRSTAVAEERCGTALQTLQIKDRPWTRDRMRAACRDLRGARPAMREPRAAEEEKPGSGPDAAAAATVALAAALDARRGEALVAEALDASLARKGESDENGYAGTPPDPAQVHYPPSADALLPNSSQFPNNTVPDLQHEDAVAHNQTFVPGQDEDVSNSSATNVSVSSSANASAAVPATTTAAPSTNVTAAAPAPGPAVTTAAPNASTAANATAVTTPAPSTNATAAAPAASATPATTPSAAAPASSSAALIASVSRAAPATAGTEPGSASGTVFF